MLGWWNDLEAEKIKKLPTRSPPNRAVNRDQIFIKICLAPYSEARISPDRFSRDSLLESVAGDAEGVKWSLESERIYSPGPGNLVVRTFYQFGQDMSGHGRHDGEILGAKHERVCPNRWAVADRATGSELAISDLSDRGCGGTQAMAGSKRDGREIRRRVTCMYWNSTFWVLTPLPFRLNARVKLREHAILMPQYALILRHKVPPGLTHEMQTVEREGNIPSISSRDGQNCRDY
ncbi:hypothetical protein B0H17DRAFT_1135512 [Mycena rosella]|uniref:Uncharacterized protein n=1 Tax=Mycena rosella TaxID=1033263 RepID=A0AAD7GFL6_MYCRO|nr:hypothetical protein B0H17DRAFT_1135512 [Mycena rosella]